MAREIVERREFVSNDTTDGNVASNQSAAQIIGKIIYVIFAIITTLLALRFVLALLGANTANGIVNALYDVTQPFVAPFANFFTHANSVTTASGSRFELETLLAIIFFVLFGWIVSRLVSVFDARERV